MHPDHVLGTRIFQEIGAEVIGHEKLANALTNRGGNYLESLALLIGQKDFVGTVIPTVVTSIEGEHVLDLGGRELHLRAWEMAHTETDLTVFDPLTGVLVTGDLVFDQHAPALDGSLCGWQRVLAAFEDEEIKAIIPGHGGPILAMPGGLDAMTGYLDVLAHDTKEAIERGERMGAAVQHIAEGQRPHWHLFDEFNPRNATVAFGELEWE
jgi:quinoprotein relay system zinc metallohydrolase 2